MGGEGRQDNDGVVSGHDHQGESCFVLLDWRAVNVSFQLKHNKSF
jgi:hypothetical protein